MYLGCHQISSSRYSTVSSNRTQLRNCQPLKCSPKNDGGFEPTLFSISRTNRYLGANHSIRLIFSSLSWTAPNSSGTVPAAPPPPVSPPAPPPAPPPVQQSQEKRPPPSTGQGRGQLLNSISGFSKGKLKKAVTNDRSAPKVWWFARTRMVCVVHVFK